MHKNEHELRILIKDYKSDLRYSSLTERRAYEWSACLAALNNADSAIIVLKMPIVDEGFRLTARVDERFSKIRDNEKWKQYESEIIKDYMLKFPNTNFDFVQSLIEMEYWDQMHRYCWEEAVKQHGPNSDEAAYRAKLMDDNDEANIRRLDSLINMHGWPSKLTLGEGRMKDFAIIFIHSDLDFKLKYIDKIEASVASGDIPKNYYSYIVDKVRIEQKMHQVYGTQMYIDSVSRKIEFHPIENIDEVDRRRNEAGLDSLHFYLNRMKKMYEMTDE